MRLCGRCRAAENPQGKKVFYDSPEGVLCSDCYKRLYLKISADASAGEGAYVVIPCPDCRGQHHAVHGNPCPACTGYGAVRIAKNALSVYGLSSTPRILVEDINASEHK